MIATCGEAVSGTPPTLVPTDNQGGNTYTPAPALFGANEVFIASYYSVLSVSSGTFTVTCTSSSNVHTPSVGLLEFSGLTTLDQTATSTPNQSTSITTNSLSTTKAVEVLVACQYYGAGVHIYTPGTSYTMAAISNGSLSENNTMACEYQYVSSTGTYSATMTTNDSGNFKVLNLASYGGASGAAAGHGPPIIWIQ